MNASWKFPAKCRMRNCFSVSPMRSTAPLSPTLKKPYVSRATSSQRIKPQPSHRPTTAPTSGAAGLYSHSPCWFLAFHSSQIWYLPGRSLDEVKSSVGHREQLEQKCQVSAPNFLRYSNATKPNPLEWAYNVCDRSTSPISLSERPMLAFKRVPIWEQNVTLSKLKKPMYRTSSHSIHIENLVWDQIAHHNVFKSSNFTDRFFVSISVRRCPVWRPGFKTAFTSHQGVITKLHNSTR
jgi:hypothetical protein